MISGPASILTAWNSAAFDKEKRIIYFWGGGHADYGGNEVYRFELDNGKWKRLTNPSPLDHVFTTADYNKLPDKPRRRFCWTPDTSKVPASAHSYDGLIFSHVTKTLFVLSMRAANGACFEDKVDHYKESSKIIGTRSDTQGWYEFNPSENQTINGIPPLSWRKVFGLKQLQKVSVHQGYPVSFELGNEQIVFGSKYRTVIYNPAKPAEASLKAFTKQADWGDGTKEYDHHRNIVWSMHRGMLLGFSADNGQLIRKIPANIAHEKSLAIDRSGRIFSWNGKSGVFSTDPDRETSYWNVVDWGDKGPQFGHGRVYGKWLYLPSHDVFVGLSNHKTGVWVYKHSKTFERIHE